MMNQTFNRHRRLRANAAMRDLVKETRLHSSDFIYPLFVVEGLEGKKEVPSMPGVYHVSLDLLKDEMAELISLGIVKCLIHHYQSFPDMLHMTSSMPSIV